MMQEDKNMSFEERLNLVQEITKKIESGVLPLEDSVKEYERGMKILAELDSNLKDMNRRITELRDGKETEGNHAES